MTLDHYVNKLTNQKFKKIILAEGNKPLAFFFNDSVESLSEVPLERQEIEFLLKDLAPMWASKKEERLHSYSGGKAYALEVLSLKDHLSVTIFTERVSLENLEEQNLPAYVNDWTEAKEGMLFFYGSDLDLVNQVRLSYCKKRAEKIKGSSLIFRSSELKFSGAQGHSISFSGEENEFLESYKFLNFETFSFEKEFLDHSCKGMLKLCNQGSLLTLNSYWKNLSMVWSDLINWSSQGEGVSQQMSNNILGFVGVRSVISKEKKWIPFFEVLPFDRNLDLLGMEFSKVRERLGVKGLSFNQSLHSLVLKQEVDLEEAYKVSPYPQELNKILESSGV